MVWETWVQSQVESYQWFKKLYLMPPCFIISIIGYVSRVKWSSPGKGEAPTSTNQCSSYWKESLWMCSVMFTIVGNENELSSNLGQTVCVLLYTKALGKGMNPSLLSQVLVNSWGDWFESNGLLIWWQYWHLQNCHWSLARRYISTIYVYNLHRLCTLNVDRSNQRKWFYTKKAKRQTTSCRNYNRSRLHR